jgi:hypothetical protein
MVCRSLVAEEAVGRLSELDLSVEVIERAVRRADAEASMCTALDPPIMEGLTRWARTNRFLREELIPLGWNFDNPRNLPRTIHPGGKFAVIATTGDDLTGLVDVLPATRYTKGYATIKAVEANGQLTLDFGEYDLALAGSHAQPGDLLTWFLLFNVDGEDIHVELSLPDAIVDGHITSWSERVILPSMPRTEDLVGELPPSSDGAQDDIIVDVARR